MYICIDDDFGVRLNEVSRVFLRFSRGEKMKMKIRGKNEIFFLQQTYIKAIRI